MDPAGSLAGKYHLEHPLGSGGMGEVWAAVNQITGRPVAIKRMHSSTPELRARMLREARAVGTLKHKNIVDIYDVGETETGDPFLVMERLYGEALSDYLARAGRLPPTEVVAIAIPIAAALKAAHAKGIVHRDLKPANVFLHREAEGEEPIVKVLDFGVSKHLQAAGPTLTVGSLVGSPAYMSPEQAESADVDARSDLWALGVVLFEMLSGRRPFPGDSPYLVIADIVHGAIPSIADAVPGLPPALIDVVQRCLTRDVNKRVASAEEVIRLLGLVGAAPPKAPPDLAVSNVVAPDPAAPKPSVATMRIVPMGQPIELATKAIQDAPMQGAAPIPPMGQGAVIAPSPRSRSGIGIVAGAAALVFVVVLGLMLRWTQAADDRGASGSASGAKTSAEEGIASKPPVSDPTASGAKPEASADPTPAQNTAATSTPTSTPTSTLAAEPDPAVAPETPTTTAKGAPTQAPARRHASGEKRLVLP